MKTFFIKINNKKVKAKENETILDVANKIGTYGLAVCAKYHGVPFYVAAPSSTFDMTLASGDEIPIEERGAEEVAEGFGVRTVVEGVKIYNPAFDVTPGELIKISSCEFRDMKN